MRPDKSVCLAHLLLQLHHVQGCAAMGKPAYPTLPMAFVFFLVAESHYIFSAHAAVHCNDTSGSHGMYRSTSFPASISRTSGACCADESITN
jgi:hypothetical protein